MLRWMREERDEKRVVKPTAGLGTKTKISVIKIDGPYI